MVCENSTHAATRPRGRKELSLAFTLTTLHLACSDHGHLGCDQRVAQALVRPFFMIILDKRWSGSPEVPFTHCSVAVLRSAAVLRPKGRRGAFARCHAHPMTGGAGPRFQHRTRPRQRDNSTRRPRSSIVTDRRQRANEPRGALCRSDRRGDRDDDEQHDNREQRDGVVGLVWTRKDWSTRPIQHGDNWPLRISKRARGATQRTAWP